MKEHDVAVLPAVGGSVTSDVLFNGGALQQVKTQFTTAVVVQKPRQKMKVLAACEEEATLAGDEFYYAWTVNTKDQGKKLVEGASVNLALAAVREWGNSGVMVDVQENADSYVFTATFVDLETGFNLQRTFRQRKSQDMGKKMDRDRAEDIVFQIGQSKAIRNVVVNALPSWLVNKMLDKAKANIVEKINKKGLAQARTDTVAFFAKYSITVDRIEAKLHKKSAAWDAEDLARLHGAIRSLTDGQESPEELFPVVAPAYAISKALLDELYVIFDQLKINQANRHMELSTCKNDEEAKALKARLTQNAPKVETETTPAESTASAPDPLAETLAENKRQIYAILKEAKLDKKGGIAYLQKALQNEEAQSIEKLSLDQTNILLERMTRRDLKCLRCEKEGDCMLTKHQSAGCEAVK